MFYPRIIVNSTPSLAEVIAYVLYLAVAGAFVWLISRAIVTPRQGEEAR